MCTERHAVLLLAGGRGSRLGNITDVVPKPLIPVAGTTGLERALAAAATIRPSTVFISVCHRSQMIRAFVSTLTLSTPISFIEEAMPLGTAGALKCCRDAGGAILVSNTDILSDIPFVDVVKQHIDTRSALTIVAVEDQRCLPYGELSAADDGVLLQWTEKVVLTRWVSAGVYVVSLEVIDLIKPAEPIDMNVLATRAQNERMDVRLYYHHGHWADIANWDDLARAESR